MKYRPTPAGQSIPPQRSSRRTPAPSARGIVVSAAVLILAASCSLWSPVTAQRYALVIGIADYLNYSPPPGGHDLQYTDDDARYLAKTLKADGWTVRDPLIDAEATKTGIQNAISSFFGSIPRGATALVYYSGHGTLTNDGFSGDAVLVPYEFNPLTWSPYITELELSSWIADSAGTRTANIIVILDSCNSGGFVSVQGAIDSIPDDYDPPLKQTTPSLLEMAFTRFSDMLAAGAQADGALKPIVLSAAGYGDVSFELDEFRDPKTDPTSDGHGIFTYFLVESMRKGDRNGDGFVTCSEAYSYASRQIDLNWNRSGDAAVNSDAYNDGYYRPHMTGGLRDLVLFAPGK